MITYEKRWGDTMYNEEQKLKYLETIESASSRKSIGAMFNRFEKYEHKLDRDIAGWGPEQIYEMLADLHSFDFGTIKQYISSLSSYRDYIGTNTATLCAQDVDLTNAIKCSIIPNPQVLVHEIKKIRDPSQGYYICAAACFTWLGIDINIAPKIDAGSVNFVSKSIVDHYCGVCITDIDQNIIDVLKEYWGTKEAIRGNGMAYPLNNGKFLRLMVGFNSAKIPAPIKVASIHTDFSNMKKEYTKKYNKTCPLGYSELQKGGGLYRLYQLEKMGVDISKSESDASLLSTYSAPGKTFDIRSLYRQYKRAFNLD